MKSAALILVACLASASAAAGQSLVWERRALLEKEDLRSAVSWIQKKDPRAERFAAYDKRPIDSTYSVLLVSANLDSLGVFVVYGKTNQVYMVLDILPLKDLPGSGQIQEATTDSMLLEFYGFYDLYQGARKYIYDLSKKKIYSRISFGRVGLVASAISNGVAYYAAPTALYSGNSGPTVATERRSFIVAVEPGSGDSPPRCRLVEWDPANPSYQVRVDVRGGALVVAADGEEEAAWELPNLARRIIPPPEEPPDGVIDGNTLRIEQPGVKAQTLVVLNKEAQWSSQPGGSSGIRLVSRDRKWTFYPVPIPDLRTYNKFRGMEDRHGWKPEASSLYNKIGPFALEGSTLWFANDFYDGEGHTGVGAIGSFDLRTLKYELRHFPEIAPWAGSAILVEKDAIWVGLMHNPEGSAYGGGLVRYDRNTGLIRRYDFPGLVYTIDRMGESIYLGTSYGLYVLRTGKLTEYRFEPVSPGNWGIVVRPL